MNPGDPDTLPPETSGAATFDRLIRAACEREPDALALCDPANRSSIDEVEPLRLSWAQTDRAIAAVAARLRRLGLGAGSVVAVQLPNTVESIVTLLGVLRAGMTAAPLPMLWRRQECVEALSLVGAKAIVTTSRICGEAHGEIARDIAADVFAIRYVCCFGRNVPDGTIPLAGLLASDPYPESLPAERDRTFLARAAIATFDVSPHGIAALARSQPQLIAGGQALVSEAGLQPRERIVAGCSANSLAGLTSALLPWLLTGGTLTLHHPFDEQTFADQCSGASTAIVPGGLLPRLEEAALLAGPGLRRVIALWRAPERAVLAGTWARSGVRLTDALAFGETAVLCAARTPSGRPTDIPFGRVTATDRPGESLVVAETTVTDAGTLAIRGPGTPAAPFPSHTRTPASGADAGGFADTGYPCRLDRERARIALTGPPAGLVTVGSYRFRQDDLQSIAASLGDAVLAALPDALSGHRLAGQAADGASAQRSLAAQGFNPLISGAFAPRRRVDAA